MSLIIQKVNIVLIFANYDAEGELGSIVVLRLDTNGAAEGLDDVLGDHQAESNALCVHLPGVLQGTEQLEQL